MKRIAILGSTGSIGSQTLDVVAQYPDLLEVVALAAGSNGAALQEQARRFGVGRLALYADPQNSGLPTGMNALVDLATAEDIDVVVVSVAGVIGLKPTIAAIQAGKEIALASKEVLVAAGEIVSRLARDNGVAIRPIDSEHSAIFQCLQGYRTDQVERLVITASGGPFRGRARADLESVTIEQALAHPTWRMGGKITIDSATLMNKGLEMIEARWLFDIPMERVDCVVHPQSIVHSFVEFRDGSMLGQLGWPNMRLPIAYALLYPDRISNDFRRWNPTDTPNLTFEPVDEATFPSIGLARRSVAMGGTGPCAMNAANEEAANAFLRGEIGFLRITELVERALNSHVPVGPNLENLLICDAETRSFVRNLIQSS